MSFEEKRTEQFERDLGDYRSLRSRIDRRMITILQCPYGRSHSLGPGKWGDYTGKRGAHFGRGGMAFVLAICEECIQNGWQEKNLPWCGSICDMQSLKRVVWMAFRPHDDAYGKK